MTNDLSDFEQQLGQELRAAAYRRLAPSDAQTPFRRAHPILLGLLAAVTLVIAAFVITEIQPQPAAAHPFKVIFLEDEIQLEIVNLVENPRTAESELQEELGIDIEFIAVPAPLELLNEVIGAMSTGTTNPRVVVDESSNSKIVLPQEIDGTLIIQYGREARSGERYLYTVTSSICRELWATTPQESFARLSQLAEFIRYDIIDSNYNYRSEVSLSEINPDYRLIDAIFLSDDELLVAFAAHLDALGNDRPICGWSIP